MPAFAILFKGLIYSIIALALIGCSRDNTVSIPTADEIKDELFCFNENESPFDIQVFKKIELLGNELDVDSIEAVNSFDSQVYNDLLYLTKDVNKFDRDFKLGEVYPFESTLFESVLSSNNYVNESNATLDFDQSNILYTLPDQSASYLTNQYVLQLTPISGDDTFILTLNANAAEKIKEREAEIKKREKDVKEEDKSEEFDFGQYLTQSLSQIELRSVKFEVSSIQEHLVENDKDTDFARVDVLLQEGQNTIILKASLTLFIPQTGLECDYSVEESNVDTITSRTVTIEAPYVLNINRGTETEFMSKQSSISLGSTENRINDKFGTNISISGDYLAVGLPNDDSELKGVFSPLDQPLDLHQAASSGAVYLYKLIDGEYEQLAFIKSSNAEAGDMFGYSVSLENNTLIVSAIDEDGSGEGVYAYIDEDSDGVNDRKFIENNNLAPDSGAIYAFTIPEVCSLLECHESISQTNYIKIKSNLPAYDGFDNDFGETVLLKENTLFITAPKDDNINTTTQALGPPNSGAVYAYLYSPSDQKFTFSSQLRAPELDAEDRFGSSIDYSNNRLIIGVPNEDSASKIIINSTSILTSGSEELREGLLDNTNEESGAAYIYENSGGFWQVTTFIKPSNSDSLDLFGTSVSILGSQIAIGASHEDGSGVGFNRDIDLNTTQNSGAVYLYSLSDENEWIETTYVKGPNVQQNALFGEKVILDDNNLLVSASLFDIDGSDTGRFYVFSQTDAWVKDTLKNKYGVLLGESKFADLYPNITLNGWKLNFILEGQDQSEYFSQNIAISDNKIAISSPNYSDLEPVILKEKTGKVSIYYTTEGAL